MLYKKRAAVITLSDKGFHGGREDTSGPCIKKIMEESGYLVVKMEILPDEIDMIEEKLCCLADENICDVIITTGGTGLSKRDVTPEATEHVIDKKVPGIAEAIRAYSMTITKRAMLGRGVAGIRKDTLIINLPGSTKAVRESLTYILDTLDHGLDIMLGHTGECGGK